MMGPLKTIGAVASIGFNLMFVGGFAYQSLNAPEKTGPIEIETQPEDQVVDDLNLDLNDEQKQAIGAVQSQLQQEQAATQQSMYLAKQSLWQEMSQGNPDQARIDELNQEIRDLHQQLREQQSQQFNEFMETLTPEQRQAVADRARQHHKKRYDGFHRKLIEKFDQDGDGQLSEQERRDARGKMMKHHKRRFDDALNHYRTPENSEQLDQMNHEEKKEFLRKKMMEKMLEKYDSNGDGQLDDAEKRKIREDRMKKMQNGFRDRHSGHEKKHKPERRDEFR